MRKPTKADIIQYPAEVSIFSWQIFFSALCFPNKVSNFSNYHFAGRNINQRNMKRRKEWRAIVIKERKPHSAKGRVNLRSRYHACYIKEHDKSSAQWHYFSSQSIKRDFRVKLNYMKLYIIWHEEKSFPWPGSVPKALFGLIFGGCFGVVSINSHKFTQPYIKKENPKHFPTR